MSYKEWFEENKKDLINEYLDKFTHNELKDWIIDNYKDEFLDEYHEDFEEDCMCWYYTEQEDKAFRETLRS